MQIYINKHKYIYICIHLSVPVHKIRTCIMHIHKQTFKKWTILTLSVIQHTWKATITHICREKQLKAEPELMNPHSFAGWELPLWQWDPGCCVSSAPVWECPWATWRGREQTSARLWNGQRPRCPLLFLSFSKKWGRRDMLHKEIQHIFIILRSWQSRCIFKRHQLL